MSPCLSQLVEAVIKIQLLSCSSCCHLYCLVSAVSSWNHYLLSLPPSMYTDTVSVQCTFPVTTCFSPSQPDSLQMLRWKCIVYNLWKKAVFYKVDEILFLIISRTLSLIDSETCETHSPTYLTLVTQRYLCNGNKYGDSYLILLHSEKFRLVSRRPLPSQGSPCPYPPPPPYSHCGDAWTPSLFTCWCLPLPPCNSRGNAQQHSHPLH